ncbi:hypothetical protein MJO28_010608 [Puccinia striiformis f. sp. tritici]|uniref:RNase III domain-containing protein n=2 Tax=Puccinia striiformis TaxID=27350 RepID=A0A2S4UX70_9BASI|nr:hypothetical protein MJO28_010608 [Puccinia striiformis f. sp. tritici]POW01755.1 hypothetical protein PSTT_12235 [Puccinia striiformis]
MKTSQHLSSLSRGFSTQAQPAASRLPGSFKLGPYRGALLTKLEQGNSSQDEHKKINHHYSASQLFRPNTSISAASTRFTVNSSTNSRLHFPHSSLIKQHLEELLYPLCLEAETEGGVGFAKLGEHNTKLSFIGCRANHFTLANFLIHAPKSTTSSSLNSEDPHQRISKSTSEVLEDALLTQFVLVEAIVGAVMAEHGTRLSMAVFHSLVLPHLSFRLDKSYLPAIKAVQQHDHELENPDSGIIDWDHLDVLAFINTTNDLDFNSLSNSAPVCIADVS